MMDVIVMNSSTFLRCHLHERPMPLFLYTSRRQLGANLQNISSQNNRNRLVCCASRFRTVLTRLLDPVG